MTVDKDLITCYNISSLIKRTNPFTQVFFNMNSMFVYDLRNIYLIFLILRIIYLYDGSVALKGGSIKVREGNKI